VISRACHTPGSACPVRVADDAAKIGAHEFLALFSNHVVIDIAESGVRLVLVTIVKRLDDFFLEVFRRGCVFTTASRSAWLYSL